MTLPLIAMDGPAGAGKSTTSREVALRLGIPYFDSGAIYRAVSIALKTRGVTAENRSAVTRLLETIRIECAEDRFGARVWIEGEEVTSRLRNADVAVWTSEYSVLSEVREPVSRFLRQWTARGFGVMEGRDIGTVILPDAPLKLFVTARAEVRAMRRAKELGCADDPVRVAELANEITLRDQRDSQRVNSPMRKADDAVTFDTSDLTFDEQVMAIIRIASERFNMKVYG